jgi:thiamine-monophosphate kinase
MDERDVLAELEGWVPAAGDDVAVIEDLLLTTDMLHEATDFPNETTKYTAGWRAVGASLSDIAAMGGDALAAVAIYGAPTFDSEEISRFIEGAQDVCDAVDAAYVGGDMDSHQEFTVSSTALGRTADPVSRSGASPGEVVCVTGTLGRSAAAVSFFDHGDHDRGNDLFRFQPRVSAGRILAESATAMIDSSDGLARSLHQLAEASDCGIAIESPVPIDESVDDAIATSTTEQDRRAMGLTFGEDFELVCTLPADEVGAIQDDIDVQFTQIGHVVEEGVTLDGDALHDRGYTHGSTAL